MEEGEELVVGGEVVGELLVQLDLAHHLGDQLALAEVYEVAGEVFVAIFYLCMRSKQHQIYFILYIFC